MPHELSWATKILNYLPIRWLLQLKTGKSTPFFSRPLQKTEEEVVVVANVRWLGGTVWILSPVERSSPSPLPVSEPGFLRLCVFHNQEGTGRESIASIFSYSWVLSMGSCKKRWFFSHELSGHLQLWWQVMDDNVAVRAARQMSRFGKLPCLNRCFFAQTNLESPFEEIVWPDHHV